MRGHAWSGASILVKGLLVVALPVLMLTISAGAVFFTSRAHVQAERQREAAESVQAASEELREMSVEGAALMESYFASGRTGRTPEIEHLETAWLHAVGALTITAHAQSDRQLIGEAQRLQAGSDVLFEVLDDVLAAPDVSVALTPARTERLAGAIDTVTAATDAMAARSANLAAEYARLDHRLSTLVDVLLLVGTPLGIVAALVGMRTFAQSIARRVRQLEANAHALGDGAPLTGVDHGDDELGLLGRGLDRADALLRDREDTLRQSEQRLALALEAGGLGPWSVDVRAGSSVWSEQCERVHGIAPGTFSGRFEGWLDLIHPDDRAAVLEAGNVSTTTGGKWSAEYRTVRSDGSIRWVEAHVQRVFDEHGAVVGLVGVAGDVTDRRTDELALREAMVEADRANAAKSEFLSRVSHELRTPLNAILGFGQLLEMEDLTESQDESVAQVLRGGRHLLAVIDDVLDVSRIESGALAMSIEPVGLAELLAEAIPLVTPMAHAHDVRIEGPDLRDADVHVFADRRRLKQVIVNLASNAIKFNHPGGVVTFRCAAVDGERVRLDVIDTGCGIPDDVLHRMFTPFDRLGAEHTPVEGTGIGLALSQRLAQAQGGTISVESELGKGSTFSVELVLAHEGLTNAVIADEDEVFAGGEGILGTVLYIEDNPSNVTLLQRVLDHRPDIRLAVATTGEMGLSVAARVPVDLILLDLHLPDLDGAEVLRRLRESPTTASTPVIILSADATPSQVERLRDAGALDYLTKPLDLHHLVRVLDDVLSGVPV
jgi:PAS domain S-box-containing protein